jgi:hypothetical protein
MITRVIFYLQTVEQPLIMIGPATHKAQALFGDANTMVEGTRWEIHGLRHRMKIYLGEGFCPFLRP